ncbi:uncharacterized protein LOC106164353 isoform X2 [Lingula anatina]|uniref:Uncharacterized protein LOC106164353 isoform X2 n=1 Tax=Lingula anatina TaxID=7574 RepID=A0A2R2MLG7_LINAN|nr:uncharacterized protein LOC106164353 isoform X2 [Lingula anatina]|eukprot:XP_023931063.1 uncharacterized protein LOC106164353 isoform X2 [Lingula anatina]
MEEFGGFVVNVTRVGLPPEAQFCEFPKIFPHRYSVKLDEIRDELRKYYDVAGDDAIKLTYLDEEKEEVHIDSQEELHEALKVAQKEEDILQMKMEIIKDGKKASQQTIQPDQEPLEASSSAKSVVMEESSTQTEMDLNHDRIRKKKRKFRDHYDGLAAEVGKICDDSVIAKAAKKPMTASESDSEDATCSVLLQAPGSPRFFPGEPGDQQPPAWFHGYMKMFKNAVVTEVTRKVTRRVMNQVKRTLKQGDQNTTDSEQQDTQSGVSHFPMGGDEGEGEEDLTTVLSAFESIRPRLRSSRLAKRLEKFKQKELRRLQKRKRRVERMHRGSDVPEERESACKRERLDLPQFRRQFKMDCQFVSDETIPDDTILSPGTKFVKKWKVKNTGNGSWTRNTKLFLIWGSIPAVSSEVAVPPVQPGEEGLLTVELVAPETPGNYQSHWRLQHDGVRFGHRVWCSIMVKEREILETNTQCTHNGVRIPSLVKACTSVCGPDQGAGTENVTPEPSPAHIPVTLAPIQLPCIETLNIQDDVQEQDQNNNEAPDVVDVIALDSFSECSDGSSSLDDFYMVPLPACFDTSVPLDKSISGASLAGEITSPSARLICLSSEEEEEEEEGAAALPSSELDVQVISCTQGMAALSSRDSSEESTDDTTGQGASDLQPAVSEESSSQGGDSPSVKDTRSGITRKDSNPFKLGVDVPGYACRQDTDVPPSAEATEKVEVPPPQDDDDSSQHGEDATQRKEELSSEGAAAAGGAPRRMSRRQRQASLTEIASNLSEAAIELAAKTATQAYTTARDVFFTWQGKSAKPGTGQSFAAEWTPQENHFTPPKNDYTPPQNDYTLPKSDYTPPQNDYTPPQDDYTPPQNDYSPPESDYTPPASTWTPPPEWTPPKPSTPMDQLINMGFGNRAQNQYLLEKHSYDVQKVVEELVNDANAW